MTPRILAAAPALVLLAACGGGSPSATAPPASSAPSAATQPSTGATPSPAATTAAEPHTEAAARALAQEEADRYASGDYEGAWELWSAADQKLVSAADYVRLHTACPPPGAPYKVEAVRLGADGNSAVARLSAMGFQFSYPLVYEAGRWRWKVTANDAADYRKGVDKLIAAKRKAGTCKASG